MCVFICICMCVFCLHVVYNILKFSLLIKFIFRALDGRITKRSISLFSRDICHTCSTHLATLAKASACWSCCSMEMCVPMRERLCRVFLRVRVNECVH